MITPSTTHRAFGICAVLTALSSPLLGQAVRKAHEARSAIVANAAPRVASMRTKIRPAVPVDFDLALERADVLVVARARRERDGSKTLLVAEVLHRGHVGSSDPRAQQRLAAIQGVQRASLLTLDDLERFGAHIRVPVDGRSYLVFAQWAGSRWVAQQTPGSLCVWRQHNADAIRVLTKHSFELLASTNRHADSRQARARVARAVDALIGLAQVEAKPRPSIAAASLRAVTRRASADVSPRHFARLRALLRDSGLATPVRDGAARCLTERDVGLPAELKTLLVTAEAKGLGRLFGRLIESRETETSVDALASLLPRARAGAHVEILLAISACGPKGSRRIARLASDPTLPTTLRTALQQLARE